MLNLQAGKQYVFSLNLLCLFQKVDRVVCYRRYKKDVSKSAITATGFNVEDQHLIKCSKLNKKY